MIDFISACEIIKNSSRKEVPIELRTELSTYQKNVDKFGPDSLVKRFFLIHLTCSLVSLGFCHQFGIGYFNYSLFTILSYLTLPIANFISGFLLMGLSSFVSTFYLSDLEKKLVLNQKPESLLGITILTSLIFIFFGENTWYNTVFWILGGSFGSYYCFFKGVSLTKKN